MQKTLARKKHLQHRAQATVNAAIMRLLQKDPARAFTLSIKRVPKTALGTSLVLGLFSGVVIGYFIKRNYY